MNKWTLKEIGDILVQLDKQGLPFQKYSISQKGGKLKLLGKGGFAYVFEAEKRETHKSNFAIKVIGFRNRHIDSEFFRSTVEVQKELGEFQDDVVKVYDYSELFVWITEGNQVEKAEVVTDKDVSIPRGNVLRLQFIVMEKLVPIIETDKVGKPHLVPDKLAAFEESEIVKLAHDIGNALVRAHEKNVLHRDIKLENVFYSPRSKHYKLGDFGIAKVTDSGMASTMTFTKGYGAPEIVNVMNDLYDNTADIYSLGMMLFVIANGLKFPDSENYNVNLPVQYQQGYRLPHPEYGSEQLYLILEKMCRFDPDERQQSMEEVQNDFNRLFYNEIVQYKVKHRKATATIAVFFWLFGIALWCLAFGSGWSGIQEWQFYVLTALGVGKAVWGVANKEQETNISLLILEFGVYYLIATGFTWMKLLFLFILFIIPGGYAGALAGTLLTVDIMEQLISNGILVRQDFFEYSWIPIALVSIAFVLAYQYMILIQNDAKLVRFMFSKSKFWILCSLIYLTFIYDGYLRKNGEPLLLQRILENSIFQAMASVDFMKVGICGLLFLGVWEIRERLLMKQKM